MQMEGSELWTSKRGPWLGVFDDAPQPELLEVVSIRPVGTLRSTVWPKSCTL